MIHGDLHTGSIMVTATETRVIDPEFAFYGPMGFDIGAVIGNLLLAYFAQAGHETAPRSATITGAGFSSRSIRSGPSSKASSWGCGATITPATSIPPLLFADAEGQGRCAGCGGRHGAAVRRLVGFAAAKMIRRILGLAHIEEWRQSPIQICAPPAKRGRFVWRATCWSIAVSYRRSVT